MCSINHDKKALFIHIPKTGGSYIAEVLSKHYGFKNHYLQRYDHKTFCNGKDKSVDKHENKIHGTLMYYKTSKTINKIIGMTEEKWNTYFIFTFVRNPYDRIVSGWNYVNHYNIPFKNYLDLCQIANSYDYWHVFMSQTRHLISNNGKIHPMGYIGKFENIENDLKHILNKIGFNNIIHKSFIKNGRDHDDYKTYYNDDNNEEILRKVNIFVKEDLDNFIY
jgi:hypothetical protein